MTKRNQKLNIHFLFSTFFGLGKTTKYFSILSASIVAIPITYLLLFIAAKLLSFTNLHTPFYHLSLAIFLLTILIALAIHSSGVYAKQINKKDPVEVVIDEVLGQTTCMILTIPLTFPLIILSNLSNRLHTSNLVILSFALVLNIILFRIFDSLKPWPISRIEKLKGGFGIILDDIAAGFFAALTYYTILLIIIS
ncbi:MAG: phosphatidylglycerophosphatase A [Rickettsiales bacterium]|nr:phosphatidylglycerophosphatase A [Rickettsiales bacterium]